MEYSENPDTGYLDCNDVETIPLLPEKEYYVRYSAVAAIRGAFHSAPMKITTLDPSYTLNIDTAFTSFGTFVEGYAEAPAADAIVISSSGSADAAISNVEVDDTAAFTIDGSGDTVTAGGSIDTWTIRPNVGLAAGNYAGTITVTYGAPGVGTGETTTHTVYFTVQSAATLEIDGDFDFGSELLGYAVGPEAESITITNTGGATATIDGIDLAGGIDFIIDGTSPLAIESGIKNNALTIRPAPGLSAGTYETQVVVKYSDETGSKQTAQDVKFKVNPIAAFTDVDGAAAANGSDSEKTTKITLHFKYPVDLSAIGDSHSVTAIEIGGGAVFDQAVAPVQGADQTVWTIGIIPDENLDDNTLLTVTLRLNEATYAAQIAILNAQIPTISSDVKVRNPKQVVETDDYTVLEHFGVFSGSGTRSAKIDADHELFVRLIHIGSGTELTLGDQYQVAKGSTVVTLAETYLKTLKVGKHQFRAEYSTGRKAIVNLTVESPKKDIPSDKPPGDTNKDDENPEDKNPDDKNKDDGNGGNGGNDGNGDNNCGSGSANGDPASNTGGLPKTGDDGNTTLWLILMIASIFGIGSAAVWRRRTWRRMNQNG
jgi:LPXTG-motif cell wall-anchored protein